ncbi:MAG: S-layer homology domain-containing protein, partial [Clostridiales Family XIII bacterium]|nr:S-layer homology domain-containing protein [Clostridiales Family XIII bacterium]
MLIHRKQASRTFAFCMAVAIALGAFGFAASPGVFAADVPVEIVPISAGFSDTGSHWGRDAVARWTELDVLRGYEDGSFRPNNPITRGEVAVILDRIMKYETAASNAFTDLRSGEFYTDAILRANAAGVMQGDGATVRPTASITREEATALLARAFGVTDASASSSFSDNSQIASWARGLVAQMASEGYVQGSGGAFRPKDSITRAEIATILDNAIGALYTSAGTYTENVSNIAIVNTTGVTLRGISVSGNVILAEGIGNGDVTLDNVSVGGKLVVRGGGSNSVAISGGSIQQVSVSKTVAGDIRITGLDNSNAKIVIDDVDGTVILDNVKAGVTLDGEVTQIDVRGGSQLNSLTLNASTHLAVDAASRITSLVVNSSARGATVNNLGTITKAEVSANGVVFEGKAPAALTVSSGVTTPPVDSSGKAIAPTSSTGGG